MVGVGGQICINQQQPSFATSALLLGSFYLPNNGNALQWLVHLRALFDTYFPEVPF